MRADIQGMRAVAVLLVVAYHVWPDRLTGGYVGVDVFFVISGFLITSILIGGQLTGVGSVFSFWARRLRRLLPAALLVLAVTLGLSRLFVNETHWMQTAKAVLAATVYGLNWQLVSTSTDYLAANATPTPVEHYWSLSVEEQFYLVWPILLLIVSLVALWTRARREIVVAVAVLAVFGASFAYSVHATAQSQASAYFLTTTRVWELAVGGLLAALSPWLRRPGNRVVAALAAWIGLAAVAIAAVRFDADTAFPGWIAIVPVFGTALFLWAQAESIGSPQLILGRLPVQWTGNVSYSVYLWHWPLLVLAPDIINHPLRLSDQLGLVGLALALGGLTKRHIEDPFRKVRPGVPLYRTFVFAVAGMLVVGAGCVTQINEVNHLEKTETRELAQTVQKKDSCLGAAAMDSPKACPRRAYGSVVPAPALAANDRPRLYDNGCLQAPPYRDVKVCHYGSGRTKVALVGNSHAAQWYPALAVIARKLHLSIDTYIASSCSTTEDLLDFGSDRNARGCRDWTKKVVAATSTARYDLVIASERNVYPVQGYTSANTFTPLETGFRKVLKTWSKAGRKVLVIRDTPFVSSTEGYIPDCVAEHRQRQNVCSGARSEWLTPDPLASAAHGVSGASVVDLSKYFCGELRCYGVNGGVITYFDGSHQTATYNRTVAPYLLPAVRAALAR